MNRRVLPTNICLVGINYFKVLIGESWSPKPKENFALRKFVFFLFPHAQRNYIRPWIITKVWTCWIYEKPGSSSTFFMVSKEFNHVVPYIKIWLMKKVTFSTEFHLSTESVIQHFILLLGPVSYANLKPMLASNLSKFWCTELEIHNEKITNPYSWLLMHSVHSIEDKV